MLIGTSQVDEFGFSITSAFKKVGHAATSTARAAGRGVATGARYTGKGVKTAVKYTVVKPIEWTVIKPTMWLAEKAMAPVKHRVQKIVQRRAAKIAWDNRKSRTPTPAEVSQARSWTRSKLLHELPHGPILAPFAGPGPMLYELGDSYQLGIAPAVVAAAVPVLIAAAQSLLSKFSSSGEAPENPGADAAAAATAPDAPVTPGQVDMTPVQDAADAANEAVQQATTPSGSTRIKGIGTVKKSHLMIGAAIVGAIVLVVALKK